ncbi:MAG: murein biosynthesis integral membrane protein MurJ [Alicyclobacillus sp.]|nr:murein biosynthesis integral membrane protein MurJ [Alicyclobacillus sp.]
MKVLSARTSTLVVGGLTLISSGLGLFREASIASTFGASAVTDAFYVALLIPEMVAGLISQSLTNAFVPHFRREIQTDRKSGVRLAWATLICSTIALLFVTLVVLMLRIRLTKLFGPGFPASETRYAVQMLDVMSPCIVVSGVSGVLWGIHNSLGNFIYPALTGVSFNVAFIIALFSMNHNPGVHSLAFAFTLGVAARFIVQLVPLIKVGSDTVVLRLWHKVVPRIAVDMLPIFVSTSVSTISPIVDRVLASSLPPGSITDLTYASKLGVLPIGLLGVPIATVMYTKFVDQGDRGVASIKLVLTRCIRLQLLCAFVLFSAYVVDPLDIIAVLFQHGGFGQLDVRETMGPLIVYGVFSFAYISSPVLTQLLYSRRKNKFEAATSFLTMAVNILGSVALVHNLGIVGLTLANSIAQVFYFSVILTKIRKELNWYFIDFVKSAVWPVLIPGLFFVGGSAFVHYIWTSSVSSTITLHLYHGLVEMSVGFSFLGGFVIAFPKNVFSQGVRRFLAGTRKMAQGMFSSEANVD